MRWWLSTGDTPEGPFPAEHVTEWLKTGQISPDTIACPEGKSDWKRLGEIGEFSHSARPGPPPSRAASPPPPTAAATVDQAVASAPADAHQTRFGILTAVIVLSACCLALDLLRIGDIGDAPCVLNVLHLCVFSAAAVTWAFFHYHLWSVLPTQFAETTPGKAVGYMFIPFYNCYWVFRSYLAVNRGLNRLADAHRIAPPHANMNLATAAAVFFVIGFGWGLVSLGLPTVDSIGQEYSAYDYYELTAAYEHIVGQRVIFDSVGFLVCWAPGFVLWLLMVLDQKRMVKHLLKSGAEVNTASGLIDE